jgi:predicted Zn-dependent protease
LIEEAMMNWTLEDLKQELQCRPEVTGWMITKDQVHRRERYFLRDGGHLAVDQDREVHQQNMSARILVKLPQAGRQGEISKKISAAKPLQPQIDSAIQAAIQTDHQAWTLPAARFDNLPKVNASDPKIAEDLEGSMDSLTSRIEKSVARKRPAVFNSAELFLSVHNRELHLSNGLVHRSAQTRVYTEAAFSMAETWEGEIKSDEYLHTSWAVNLDDLPIEKIFDEAAERAQNSIRTTRPKTGHNSVIVDAEVLAPLFNAILRQLSAGNEYHKLPFLRIGEELVPGATGELIDLTLNPALPFGAATIALSDEGLAQEAIQLVGKNRVLATATSKQYADYLSRQPTSSRGNVVMKSGIKNFKELTQSQALVLEILQFSGIFIDGNRGTFGSEIRLARLYNNETGKVEYIKGGSLSGSIRENFKNALFSKTTVNSAHFFTGQSIGTGYSGPMYALMSEVSVVGD